MLLPGTRGFLHARESSRCSARIEVARIGPFLGERFLQAHRNHEIAGGSVTHVLQAMQDSRSGKDDIARMHESSLSIAIDL
jgi:hypothetical protein